MTGREHRYVADVVWDGDKGSGTSGYKAYGREHRLGAPGKPDVPMSSDPAFRGDRARWNPEDVLVGSISSCHMLWYLHLAAEAGIVVRAYADNAEGTMVEDADGSGRFVSVVLRPKVTISAGDPERARALHAIAHAKCFIANSVNFPVGVEPTIEAAAVPETAGA